MKHLLSILCITLSFGLPSKAQTVINKDKNGAPMTITCPLCHGQGSCQSCSGRGTMANGKGTTTQACTQCKGNGLCATCKGDGKIDNPIAKLPVKSSNMQNRCTYCYGTGYLICPKCNHIESKIDSCIRCKKGIVVCYHCGGSGMKSNQHGVGSSPIKKIDTKSKTICRNCGGKAVCSICKGTRNNVLPFSTEIVKCTFCNGTGKCPTCHGTGYEQQNHTKF